MPKINKPTPEKLFAYANAFAIKAEITGKRNVYPTLRQVSKRFGLKHREIEALTLNYSGSGYLGVAVGLGSGSGIADFESKGACLLEAYA